MSADMADLPSLKLANRLCSLTSLFWPLARTPFRLFPPGVFELASNTIRQGVLNDPSLCTIRQGMK